MLRKWLLVGAAAGFMLAGQAALADDAAADRPISPFYGSINPFYGPIDPFYGTINPFYGPIDPFYGTIDPFYGAINSSYGDISPFWGDIKPFYGTIDPFYGTIDPFYGTIDPFWGSLSPFTSAMFKTAGPFWRAAGPQWGNLSQAWGQLQLSGGTNYSSVQSQLNAFVNTSAKVWGAAVQKATGEDFYDGFAAPLFAKYGIDPTDPNSLANTSVSTRSLFFLNWYDNLMSYTGVDHVDWWMASVHWSPSLTQIQGLGTNSVIGVLDANFTSDNSDVANLKFVGGYKTFSNDHGAAVASLIAAQHDGEGVMGIAPNSTIDLYNPFDQTGTASWADVAQGIYTLYQRGAYVVNASLGVPGVTLSADWAKILTSPQLNNRNHDLVLVTAAGNDGLPQTTNIPWIGNQAPNNLLVVGSIGPTDQISWFSNTPGQSCILINGVCNQQNKLMYHFLVAPGELILVSDNHGGVTRMTGTSFAAPLVTGAVALLQDRWPWLQQHAEETAQIILQSADDLGAPGVDPVYGWGKLDIQASQSPLNFNNLVVYQPYSYSGRPVMSPLLPNWSPAALKNSMLNPGQLNFWQQKGAFLVAFETIGSTFRDFNIPLSNLLVGKNQNVNGTTNPFQTYLYQRLVDWAHGRNSLSFDQQSTQLAQGDWKLGIVTTQSTQDETDRGEGPIHGEFVASNLQAGIELKIGEGSGAHAMMGDGAFQLRSDFDPSTGGVNPVLGFASGGMYASGGYAITRDLKLQFGFSEASDDHVYVDPTFGPLKALPLATAHSSASVTGLDYAVTKDISINLAYTQLTEADGLLGSQGSGALAFAGAAHTEGTTLGATAALTDGWTLSGSATMARTTAAQSATSSLSLSQSGLQSTAYELVAAKTGLLSDDDTLRVSLAQPLHIEGGALNYTALQVVDRNTGAVGPVTQSWSVAGKREYRLETSYGMSVLDGHGSLDGFAVLDLNPPSAPDTQTAVSVGGQFRIDL